MIREKVIFAITKNVTRSCFSNKIVSLEKVGVYAGFPLDYSVKICYNTLKYIRRSQKTVINTLNCLNQAIIRP